MQSDLAIDFRTKIDKPFVYGDRDNIDQTLPQLYPEQREDVFNIEARFRVGKGYLCTNSTGTGKTLVGLGVVERFRLMNKLKVLIVVPTDKKCKDWIEEAYKHFQTEVFQLEDTRDLKDGVCVTTYANFYQNTKMVSRYWDLIIYDECHYLTQNASGDFTVYLRQHKKVSNVWSAARAKANMLAGPRPQHTDPDFEERKKEWMDKYERYKNRLHNMTKVLFLSATPFAYHKSLIIGDGVLWDITEVDPLPKKTVSTAYNTPDAFQSFLMDHFGYRMVTNKLTIPDVGVDQSLMEREFFEKFKKKGVMSTRQLKIDKDYSRHFVKIVSPEAQRVNKGIELIRSIEFEKNYPYIYKFANRHFNYAFLNKLLEITKALHIKERIDQHLFMGRKVVVFHSFNKAKIEHPFRFDVDKMTTQAEVLERNRLEQEVDRFKHTFDYLWNLNMSDLDSPLEELKKHYPDALQFNGTVPKKKRNKNIQLFQDDNSGYDLLIVQSKAGREGISLHDQTGLKERVSIDLSLPTIPTEAIQKEGRIYRSGVKSNAIYEYVVLHLYFEKIAFAEKIATRSKTVENLALGNLARDLETAFKEGYMNADSKPPNISQGYKGKEFDRVIQEVSDFDRAKVYYWARIKNRGIWKNMDYFATPEPIGYKMIQWLDMKPNNHFLEPSAGHGAIGRWAGVFTYNTFIEPVADLVGKLTLNVKGKVIRQNFEDFNRINKFDYIAMNPPFGTGGKLAAEHLQKAFIHGQRLGTTIIGIFPDGPSFNKRLELLLEDKQNEQFLLTARILLPACTFKKEGTQVITQILKFTTLNLHGPEPVHTTQIDLRHIDKIEDLFNAIQNLKI